MKPKELMNVTKRLTLILLIALLCFPPDARTWGPEGHTWVNQVAAQHLPKDMPGFLRHAAGRLAYLGPEPDRWRSTTEPFLKHAQEADHYLDMERLEGFGELPDSRYAFYQEAYAKYEAAKAAGSRDANNYLPDRIGLQPYITMEVYGRLKAAFREYRAMKAEHKPTGAVEQNLVFYAGWLGHYVGDGSQPLHATIYYNGWFGPNPNGYSTKNDIHSKFESVFVAANLSPQKFSGLVHAPVRLADPFHDYLAYLKESNSLMEKVYQLEKAGALDGNGTPESIEFTSQRLAAGSQMLLNLWYTAWLESAEAVPDRAPETAPAKKPKS